MLGVNHDIAGEEYACAAFCPDAVEVDVVFGGGGVAVCEGFVHGGFEEAVLEGCAAGEGEGLGGGGLGGG